MITVYAIKYENQVTRSTIEYLMKQLYILHRVPFIMEVLSVCSDALVAHDKFSGTYISPKIIYSLIQSLSKDIVPDEVNISDEMKVTSLPPLDTIYTRNID